MRFKVNNKYVVDAKSHDDAIRVIKMLDAMETYSIRWIDTYAKAQGYGPDFWRYDAEIKANNVKEALEKLAKQVALGGTGTANCLVMHVSNSHATYQFTGRLSELLKKTKEQLGDSVKDGRIAEIMKAKVKKKFEEEKDPTDKSAKITEDGYAFEIIRANGKKVIYRADSGFVNDAEPETDVDLDFLIKDELEAIDGYRKMIAKTSNPQLLSVLSHILDEETEHVEELRVVQAVVNGNVSEKNLEDSVKDDTVMFPGSKLYKVAIKYGFLDNEKLAKKIAADPEWQAITEKYRDPLWSARSDIDRIVKKYMK